MEGILFIGHCTKDVITINGETSNIPGGGVYFGSTSAGYCLKKNNVKDVPLNILTIGAPQDFVRIKQEVTDCGCQLKLLEDSKTTTFKHWFTDNQPDKRNSSVPDIARSYTNEDIEKEAFKAKIFYVNPLLFGEIPLELFAKLKEKCEILSCDAQGLLRNYEDGKLFLKVPENLCQALKYIDILKVDNVEAEALTGLTDPREACLKLLELGPKYIIYTHKEEVEWHTKEKYYSSAFKQWSLEGRTGRGDTVSAAFIVEHFVLGLDVQTALDNAAAATGKKMMHPGPAVAADFE